MKLPGWGSVKKVKLPCNSEALKIVEYGVVRRLLVDLIAVIVACSIPIALFATALILSRSILALLLLLVTIGITLILVRRRVNRIRMIKTLFNIAYNNPKRFCGLKVEEALKMLSRR